MVDASKQIYPPKEKLQNFFETLYLRDEKNSVTLCVSSVELCVTINRKHSVQMKTYIT